MPEHEYRVPISQAANWELKNETLYQALVEEAEKAGVEKHGDGFYATEVDTKITTNETHFIVTMTWTERNEPTTETVRVSFDVTTRRAGIAVLEVPTGTCVETTLNDYLDKHGNELTEEHLPPHIKIIEWNLESPGDHTIDTDYVEPHNEEESENS